MVEEELEKARFWESEECKLVLCEINSTKFLEDINTTEITGSANFTEIIEGAKSTKITGSANPTEIIESTNPTEILGGAKGEIDAADIRAALITIARRCMQGEPVRVYDKEKREWTNAGEWKFDARGALKALELLGEACGMYRGGAESAVAPEIVLKVIKE